MKNYIVKFCFLTKNHCKIIILTLVSFCLGFVVCFFLLRPMFNHIVDKIYQSNLAHRIILDTDIIDSLRQQDSAKAIRLLETDLISTLISIVQLNKSNESYVLIGGKTIKKAFSLYQSIDKEWFLSTMPFDTEEERLMMVTSLDEIDAFFSNAIKLNSASGTKNGSSAL